MMVNDKSQSSLLLAAWKGLFIVLVGSLWTVVAASQEQRPFNSDTLRTNNGPPPPPSSSQFKSVHLSHSGVYLSSPISSSAPQFLTFSVESPLYDVESVKIEVGGVKQRNWEQVHLDCGSITSGGGIELCEKDDIHEMNTTTLQTTEVCKPYKIIPSQSRILIDYKACPMLTSLFSTSSHSKATESFLESVTLSFEIQRVFPSRIEKHLYWIGRVVREAQGQGEGDGGALWPYAATVDDDGLLSWDGRTPNRISSQMQDPYLPKASKPDSSDVLNGIDLVDSTWSLGISIRAPTNGNHSKPTDYEFEPVHSPVGGQVVWLGNYTIPMAPSNHRNDEHGFAMMIRDEWGFVYQLLGLNSSAINVKLGQVVSAGHIIGSTSRTRISAEPDCRHKPADPPEMWDKSRRYPYRNRSLRIRVARPDPSWTEWKGPLENGWQYFNPLDAFTSERFQSAIPPDPNPDQLFFARPSVDGGLTPPSIFATTKDFSQPPTLSGNVEVIVGFDAFIATPGNAGDSLDPTALHALDWAVWPKVEGNHQDPIKGQYACSKPNEVEWRIAFEHSKLPNNWSIPLLKNALLAHYVPAFIVGLVPLFKTKYSSVFDEKSRKLYYSPTRNIVGLPNGRGYWDTTKEPGGDGMYEIWVRGRDWFGNQGCFGANVLIKNS